MWNNYIEYCRKGLYTQVLFCRFYKKYVEIPKFFSKLLTNKEKKDGRIGGESIVKSFQSI
jgi:hypothetical protein